MARGQQPAKTTLIGTPRADQDLETRMAKAVAHPLRARLLALLQEGVASPNELSKRVGEPLSNVSYHVKALLQLGCIEQTTWKQRRGAIEHYYRAVTATALPELVPALPLSIRVALSADTGARAVTALAAALKDGALDDPDEALVSLTRLRLDEPAWQELAPLVEAVATRARQLETESNDRGRGKNRHLTLMLFPAAAAED